METLQPASESPGEGIINVPNQPAPTLDADPSRCPGPRADTLSINFCNIRGLTSNFLSEEHHLSTSEPGMEGD